MYKHVRVKYLELLTKTEEKLHVVKIRTPSYLDHDTMVKARALEHKHRMHHAVEKVLDIEY